ncbi:hypothetical protein ACFYMB_08495 [Micromonospora haikouensis]|uniref:hypothetical protein n=1 Tax=Micromonospora haikouensis TaxID=686309 RepID=UPI00369BF0EA
MSSTSPRKTPAGRPGRALRRRTWLATGAAGLTGVVGLAAFGVATAGTSDATAATRVAAERASDDGGYARDDRGGQQGHDGKGEERKGEDRKGEDGLGRVHEIPCDPDRLIAAIVRANAERTAATLKLAKECRYSLRTGTASTGLPIITSELNIIGERSTIERAYDLPNAGATAFRLFQVGNGGSLRLYDVTLRNGLTAAVGVTPASGGAILVNAGGRLLVEKSTLTGNNVIGTTTTTPATGGAIENAGSTVVKHSAFTVNNAFTGGGAIHNTGRLVVEDSLFEANKAGSPTDGGGGIDSVSGSVTIVKSKFVGNAAGGLGGGLNVAGGSADVAETEFKLNIATISGGGVAVTGTGTQAQLRKVELVENTAVAPAIPQPGAGGGGVFVGAGSAVTVHEAKVVANSAGQGNGGGFLNLGSLVLFDATIARNQAVNGAGIYNDTTGTVTATRTTITDNQAIVAGGGIFNAAAATAVTLDPTTKVFHNNPNNCAGPGTPIVNCFG